VAYQNHPLKFWVNLRLALCRKQKLEAFRTDGDVRCKKKLETFGNFRIFYKFWVVLRFSKSHFGNFLLELGQILIK
ncbi:unnamed protein product, partial [Arabidopsis halleri]